jgi:ABC-2 type transport system ATP-binding protein
MDKKTVLIVNNLTREYGSLRAVEDISFAVKNGEIVGLLGPNGAGKSTTINMILGVLEPTSGTVEIFGYDNKRHRSKAMEKVNFAAVYSHVPGNITVQQNLTIFGLLYGVKNLTKRIDSLLLEFDLKELTSKKVGLLSSGEQTRVNLAKSIINSPNLLLLDEPTASLDPSTARLIREKMRSYVQKSNAGILWTSHNMHEVEDVCDRVLFLSRGRILLEGNPKTLPQVHNKKDLEELFITIAREPLSLRLE